MSTELPERVDVKDVDWYTSFCQVIVMLYDIRELHCLTHYIEGMSLT